MQTSVIHSPSHENKIILKVSFWGGTDLKVEIGHKGEKYSMRNTSRVQNCKALNFFA